MITLLIQSVGTVEVLRLQTYVDSPKQRILARWDREYVIWSLEQDAEGLHYALHGTYFSGRLAAEVEFDKRAALLPA